ncbi:Uncharacterized protein OBRU01_20029, partial [Operophtera brumata]
MDDQWDVKSVRHAGQYISCMKLNGAPLLPPVLSKECREEMQYYKLLAKEVEKRISILEPYLSDSEIESKKNKTHTPESPESEQYFELARENVETTLDKSIEKNTAIAKQKNKDTKRPNGDFYDLSSTNVVTTADTAPSKLVLDFSLSINQTGRDVPETYKRKSPCPCPANELPERDYNCVKNKQLILDCETNGKQKEQKKQNIIEKLANCSFSADKVELTDPFPDSSSTDGLLLISTKSFTGSLNDLNTERGVQITTKLTRQRSYTLLNPSPQLLAHLEVESLNTGVELSCISMSDSLSNLSTPNKKRRSWDLESAKVKWSSMALELKAKQLPNSTVTVSNRNAVRPSKKTTQAIYSKPRAKSVVRDKKSCCTPLKTTPKSEPLQKRRSSPVRNIPSNVTIVKCPAAPKPTSQIKESHKSEVAPETHVVSECEDPATKVRELYDKIQTQQLAQMASLVEKQKREQMLLQSFFEEQNSLLFKQLKTIVPKSPVEAKEAWGDKKEDRGPVSLSQLINHKSPELTDSPLSSTLTNSHNYINQCDSVLKKSRDISGTINKPKSSQNGNNIQSPFQHEGSRTRTHSSVRNSNHSPVRNSNHSPIQRNTYRRLNYNSSTSECDNDPMLTDRTNDTMADLNVTFPTDKSDECEHYSYNNTVFNHLCGKDVSLYRGSPPPASNTTHCSSTDSAINCMERTIQDSINSSGVCRPQLKSYYQPTPRERAAATKIVAFAKGHLVRRLMRTERVTGTVQTIRDALLCALDLHQDREGIRGADVDLHRRLIQQITAACYSLHDTFIASSPADRCAMLAAERARRRSLAYRALVKPSRQ